LIADATIPSATRKLVFFDAVIPSQASLPRVWTLEAVLSDTWAKEESGSDDWTKEPGIADSWSKN